MKDDDTKNYAQAEPCKVHRLLNPRTFQDYGLSVKFNEIFFSDTEEKFKITTESLTDVLSIAARTKVPVLASRYSRGETDWSFNTEDHL